MSPKPLLSIVGGALAGLAIGLAAAFAWQTVDPRLRREEQLRQQYRLPILARVPWSKAAGGRPISPLDTPPPVAEAYRTLRGTLSMPRRLLRNQPSVILVTGSSASEGKTTTSINLATSLGAAGNHVILIEADLRRPAIGRALHLRPTEGVVSVLLDSEELEDALITSPDFGTNIGFLLAEQEGGQLTDLFALPAAREMLSEARKLADYVLIDSPPLNEVVDALPLAIDADEVVIAARLRHTHLRKLMQLAELLAENRIRPAGFAVVGVASPGRGDYAYFAADERKKRTLTDEVLRTGRSAPD